MPFIKLSEVKKITIKEVKGMSYKMWDDNNKKMLSSETPIEGYSPRYTVECEEGTVELSNAQMIGILAAKGEGTKKEDLTNTVFNVLSNGLSGKDRRYFFMFVGGDVPVPAEKNLYDTEIDSSVIPF